ncbi:MAG TPA: ABC transporter substrate-binding protein, partial [Abditibacteriaceae bacterium]|nr:ABC transporter substrate-binding protein [Abditibacteriaceae bacterium]
LLTGCGRVPEPQQHGLKQVALNLPSLPRDDLGREIKLSAAPRRIVTIGPGATETIFALGAGERVVGRDSGSDYPPDKVKRVPIVANFTGPFFEKTAAVRPDFIIVQGETYDKTRADLWQQKCGAPVAVLSASKVAEVAQGIEKIGAWLHMHEAAKRMANELMGLGLPAYQSSAFFEVQRSPLWTAGSGTLIDDVMRQAGFHNVARDIKGYKQYNLESLITRNPEFYIMAQKQPNATRALNELRRKPILKDLQCVRRGFVIVMPADLVLRPGPRLGRGIRMLREEIGMPENP